MNGIFVKKKREEQRKKNATLQGCTFNNKPRRMINRLIVLGEQSVVTIVACKRGFKRGWGCRSVAERAVRSPSGCPERGDYLSRRINQFEICSHATDRAVERAHRFFLPRSFHHHWFQTQIHRHQRASRSMISDSILVSHLWNARLSLPRAKRGNVSCVSDFCNFYATPASGRFPLESRSEVMQRM